MRKKTVIYQRIRELREERGMTQGDLAAKIGKTKTVIGNIETGRSRIPDDYIFQFAEIFNVSPDYLFGLTDARRRSYTSFLNADEQDLIKGFRKMNKAKKRILLGKMEELLASKEEDQDASV